MPVSLLRSGGNKKKQFVLITNEISQWLRKIFLIRIAAVTPVAFATLIQRTPDGLLKIAKNKPLFNKLHVNKKLNSEY
ncbi:hypothetical protein CBI35_01480 [Pantoea sp. AV62]|nr:hypothetical protein HA39_05855 [Pantoea brenneri]OXM26548.1 hypothetical protein CBI35_01480 [Pantoea sp. AV62]HAI07479.1 hypothetical protein [Pantoea sp.]